ncbi:Cof-type HAD-IIB family hydrolase [Anaerolentibacter hominis]|uniref:Cof-type HAD-IIB family hydrolase n=1 Tax=Anaerolentibacter hominis TaxID=3079009 RepID=UPI0031B81326
MSYRMLVLDIDGTLTNSEKIITEKTRAALIRAQKAGLKVVLASGRPTYGVKDLAKQLEMDRYGGFILSYNGGKIVDCRSGEVIFRKVIPQSRIKDVCRLAKEHQVALVTYEADQVIATDAEDQYVRLEAWNNKMEPILIPDMEAYIRFPVVKFMMVAEGDYLADVEIKVKEALGAGFSVYRSEPYFLEIMAENIDKAQSLATLLAHLGLTKEEMICCGDGLNDLTMIRFAGLGVAMENAADCVREAADFITRSNDEDGIAYVVERFIQ